MDYVSYAKQIALYLQNAENEVKEKIRRKFRQRTIGDICVLQTTLENCSRSSNPKVHADLRKHNIPARLEAVANLITGYHCHGWNEEEARKPAYSFFQCIKEEGSWNSNLRKVGIMSAGVFGGLFLLGGPTVITGMIVYKISAHAREVERELTWAVNELEAIYDQTNSLMISNLLPTM